MLCEVVNFLFFPLTMVFCEASDADFFWIHQFLIQIGPNEMDFQLIFGLPIQSILSIALGKIDKSKNETFCEGICETIL